MHTAYPVDEDRFFYQICALRGTDQLPQEHAALFKPFIANAKSGSYELARPADIDKEELAEAVATATGKSVRQVVLISMSDLASIGPHTRTQLERSQPVLRTLHFEHSKPMLKPLSEERQRRLQCAVCDHFGSALFAILKEQLVRNVAQAQKLILGSDISNTIRLLLFQLTRAIVTDDAVTLAMLTPLFIQLPKTIPLYRSSAEPATWYSLVR